MNSQPLLLLLLFLLFGPSQRTRRRRRINWVENRREEERRDEAEQHNTISINFKSHITSKQITKELICHQNHASAEIETDVDGNSDADCGEQREDMCEQRSAAEREREKEGLGERERRGRCRD